MGASTFSGPLKAGTVREGASVNVGNAVLAQTQVVAFDADLTQEAIFNLPPNAQIIDIYADVETVYNSATSATLTFGTASAGTQYIGSGVDVKTVGRKRASSITAAIATAMKDIGTNTAVYATVTSVGQPSAGQIVVTVQYMQR
jgi:hypothetical protein